MLQVLNLFESHLCVSDLERSMRFFSEIMGLELAGVFWERRVAFFWIGGGGQSMLSLWENGTGPQKMRLHVAFKTTLEDLLESPARLQSKGVIPRDFLGNVTTEPVVLAWMPAAAVYFDDPDGNLLELISTLTNPPQLELQIMSWSDWQLKRKEN